MDPFVLREARVLDARGGFTDPVDVVVRDGRIAAVEPHARATAGEVSFDCSSLWLLPGVFDCHVHVCSSSIDAMELMRTPITQWTLESAQNLRHTLEGGVTSLRDACGADAGIRESVERGFIPGPRLQISTMALCQTGGHVDGFLPGPGTEMFTDFLIPDLPGRPPYLVDGVDEMRKVVRQVLRAGADWIKLCTTGGIMSPHDEPDWPELTFEEVAIAVFEARRKGKGVMTHSFGGEGLDVAIEAGVRSIEHGTLLSEEQARRMAERGTYLVPTLAILRDVVAWARDGHGSPYAIRKALDFDRHYGHAVAIARDAGVPIAMGTDYIERRQHGRNLEEILLLHRAGLTVEEALLAATRNGAELCGVADRLGRLAPGYVFDAVVLDQDPGDLSLFADPGAVTGVFKDGVPVVPHPRLAEAVPA